MKLKTALFTAAAAIALAPAANAYEGLYGAIGAGLSYMGDRPIDYLGGALPAFDSEQDHDNGIGVYGALGYAFGNGWRGEIELNYRNNDVDSWAPDPGSGFVGYPSGTMSGDVKNYAVMFNVIRDFDFGGFVTPYLGIGVGAAHTDVELTGINLAEPSNPLVVDDHDRRFAYQGIAGLAFQLAEGLMLDISYRYFETLDNKLSGTNGFGPFAYEYDYRSHSAYAGLRWNFGGGGVRYKDCPDGSSVPVTRECPPMPIQETGAGAEPLDFIIYFDYDKSNLTPEADALIREAAQRALQNDIQTVTVEGNADRSGSSAYNQALSQRRANVVADALARYGVPRDRIQVTAYGEDNPAKPTPDGVREPLNRRTEVTIRFQ